jgi:CheY-like chemotaxis protein/HPt (histidine-containing phosphotransfer) domain-containing protein
MLQRQPALANRRVLVIDDNETSRTSLQHVLAAWGLDQRLAATAEEALGLVRADATRGRAFEVVIVDLNMPGMDGLMFARALKADPRIANTHLIMLTTLDRRDDLESFRDAGVDDYLIKPIKQQALSACLNGVFSSAAVPRTIVSGLVEINRDKPAEIGPAPEAVVMPKLRILIAEDNPVNQKVALHQLQKLGFEADAVDNGRLVLEALERTPYDLIFMDCQMPELDGYAATQEIRRREGKTKHTWIVAVTAHTLQGDREKCFAAGMDDYVSKPVKPASLQAAIHHFTMKSIDQPLPAPAAASAPVEEDVNGIVDLRTLAGFRELDGDSGGILSQLINVFLENTPVVARRSARGTGGHSAPQVARAVHTLKGSCSNFGATRMKTVCEKLEKTALAGSLESTAEMLDAIEREFNCVRSALEKELPAHAA